MTTNDVIESYITEVALMLPRAQRPDVAFELRALLTEQLQDKAEASGRAADADMAITMLREFGQPSDVAARYRPAVQVVDPSDGQKFFRWSFIGMAVIWIAGLFSIFGQPNDMPGGVLQSISRWLMEVVVGSLWWPGVLVMWFAASAASRRRSAKPSDWSPRDPDRLSGGRAPLVLAVFGMVAGLLALMDPRWILDLMFGGHAAPVAYQAMTYTESFMHGQAPWLYGLVALNVPLFITAIVRGRWSPTLRRIETGISVLVFVAMVWVICSGPAFMSPSSDGLFKGVLFLLVAYMLIHCIVVWSRTVRPQPNAGIRAG